MTMDREQLQNLHLALEAAIEQLTYAQQHATRVTEIGTPPSVEVQTIERSLGELTALRNDIRERLMKVLSRPTLGVIK
jgi:hypothetical protein